MRNPDLWGMVLDSEKKSLLKRQLEVSKIKQLQQCQDDERKRIIENVDDYHKIYRFAGESEAMKIEGFIGQLHFLFPSL